MKKDVIILFGGRSTEHEVSVESAASVLQALDRELFNPLPVGITRQGQWVFGCDPREILQSGVKEVLPAPDQNGIGRIAHILSQGDVVFPVLHGTYGEDGAVQGLLEMVDIPYVGATVGGSALGMDKIMMKALFRENGIPIVPYVHTTLSRFNMDREAFAARAEAMFPYPMFVKPASLGSSVGVTCVFNREELFSAIDYAARFDRKVVVEQGVRAREIEISIMGNDNPVASVPGEVVPGAPFYDYAAKYLSGSTFLLPADISAQATELLTAMALRAYQAIDCSGLARVDFFLTEDNELLLNEINTMPGFTVNSMYPKMWDASGLDYTSLITNLISLAFERFEAKRRISLTIRE